MAGGALLRYRKSMKNFMEIMNYCAYDVEKATEIAQKELDEIGLEKIQPQSRPALSRRLHNPFHLRGDGVGLENHTPAAV